MSMHKAVSEIFENNVSPNYPNVTLTNPDINRIVTSVVQTFNMEKPINEQIEEHAINYVIRYKTRDNKRDCGCKKR